jgi:hypothetical protein
MFVADKNNGHLIEVLNASALFDPNLDRIEGRLHYGEESQDPELFAKKDLAFPSGKSLPVCWTDPEFRRKQ